MIIIYLIPTHNGTTINIKSADEHKNLSREVAKTLNRKFLLLLLE